jgi:hypothetical protein
MQRREGTTIFQGQKAAIWILVAVVAAFCVALWLFRAYLGAHGIDIRWTR